MAVFFSPDRGFQPSTTPAPLRGQGAVKISRQRHRQLVDAQAEGALIVVGEDGRPKIQRPRDNEEARRRFARQLVKREARRRILEIAPAWRQANDNAAMALAAYQLGATCTTGVDVGPALERRREIDAVRAASERLEAAIETIPPAELEAFDVGAEIHWSPAR